MQRIDSGKSLSKRYRRPWHKSLRLAMLAALMAIVGCAAPGRPPTLSGEHVPLPEYQEGTTYVYSNGIQETVEAVGPEGVTWRNHLGTLSSGSPDFTYRRATWKTRTRSGTRRFRERNAGFGAASSASLWPLATGKTARYIESGRWQDAEGKVYTYEVQWRLEVIGQERIHVKAGEFAVWKIVARRFSPVDAFKPVRLREIKTWYYAPAAGHYVKEERHYPGRQPDRDVELLAIIPPVARMNPSAQTTAHTNFQQALEEKQSGVALSWNIAEQKLSGTTTPMATFKMGSGAYCRQYVQHLNRSGEQLAYYGLACRTDAGRWEVPQR